jgi:hypothetical protein
VLARRALYSVVAEFDGVSDPVDYFLTRHGFGGSMGRRALCCLAVVGALISAACVRNGAPLESGLGDNRGVPTVTVRNDNWLDVAVYVVRGTSRFRIGTVGSSSSRTFRLRSEAVAAGNPLQILADPIGDSRGYVTDPVVLGPGQRLELTVANPISISSFSVWSR